LPPGRSAIRKAKEIATEKERRVAPMSKRKWAEREREICASRRKREKPRSPEPGHAAGYAMIPTWGKQRTGLLGETT